jgi:uncharacterized membrane protein HdeD (DUF308 family)
MTTARIGIPSGQGALTELLAENWWAIALRGVLGIGFGLAALVVPGATMLSLMLLFAAYAFADGIFGLVSVFRAARQHERWGYLTFEALANIATAAIAVSWPGLTVVAFVFLVAFWAIVTGVLMLGAAFELHEGRGWLILSGLASLLYGVLLIAAPLLGAVVLTWWIGAYAIVFGVSLLVLAFRLRARATTHRPLAAA